MTMTMIISMITTTMISAQESSPPPNPMVYEDSFNRTLQSALLNLGKTGEHYLASFGEERARPPVSPPRMVTYQRHPSYQNGNEEEEQRRSPLTEEDEGMESQHEMENNAITYSTTVSTNNHIKTMESQEMENAITYSTASSMVTNIHIISRDDKEEEAVPQDLSMISNRNVDS